MTNEKAHIDPEVSRMVWEVVMSHLEQYLCFNRDDDPACWKRYGDFYGSSVELYYWTNKRDKATYRWAFKAACALSKSNYRIYRPKRDKMFYRMTSWKLSGFPDTFGSKCLMVFPLEYTIDKLQPYQILGPAVSDAIDPVYTIDIDYDFEDAYIDLYSYIESASGFLPLNYKPHNHMYANTIRNYPVRKLLFDVYNSNIIPYNDLSETIPSSVTSIVFGQDFRGKIWRGALPECLEELCVTSLREDQEYHVPSGLRRLSVSIAEHSYRIPNAWSTQCFTGLSDRLEYMNLRNVPIACAGCSRCAATDHAHLRVRPHETTQIPSGLKTLLLRVGGVLFRTTPVYPCAIPEAVEHLALSIENGSREHICFSGCAFPRLKTFLFHGQPCRIDQMIANSRGLQDLVVAFVHASLDSDLDEEQDGTLLTQPPHSSDMARVSFERALEMIARSGTQEATASTNSIQVMRVRFADATAKNRSDALVCGSRATMKLMLDNSRNESFLRYGTPERVDPGDLRRKFVRVVRIVTGMRIRGFRQDFLNHRGANMLKDTIRAAEKQDVRPSLVALLSPEPRDPEFRPSRSRWQRDDDDDDDDDDDPF